MPSIWVTTPASTYTSWPQPTAQYGQTDLTTSSAVSVLDRSDAVGEVEREFAAGLEGLSETEARKRLVKIERILSEWSQGRKLYGHMYDDILKLKYLHQRYSNYLRWLQWKR